MILKNNICQKKEKIMINVIIYNYRVSNQVWIKQWGLRID